MSDLKITIQHESPGDADTIERLHERAFGPGRFARTAERVREEAGLDMRLCLVARIATLVVASVRLTPIRIGTTPSLMLGPLAVEPAFRSRGIGRALIERVMADATALGYRSILLVGDEAYYGRMGFKRTGHGRIQMPGPVDPMRVLLWTVDDAARDAAKGPVRGDYASVAA